MHQKYERDEGERYINVKVVWLEKSAIDSRKLLSLLRFGYIQTITFLYLYILIKNLKVSQNLTRIGFEVLSDFRGYFQTVYSEDSDNGFHGFPPSSAKDFSTFS